MRYRVQFFKAAEKSFMLEALYLFRLFPTARIAGGHGPEKRARSQEDVIRECREPENYVAGSQSPAGLCGFELL